MIQYLHFVLPFCLTFASLTLAQDQKSLSVREVAEAVRDSIVVITTEDREGEHAGMGTGFVIDASGLIATNLHVIGEARPIQVQTRDGEKYSVTEVHASDRNVDLAIIRIEPKTKLSAIPLASGSLANGQPTVAIGHPLGLKHSVSSGVVAGERDFGEAAMWQVAMAIEPGNSGGPLLDMEGKVHGVIALKSAGSSSIGFAVKTAQLRKLIENPNPTTMDQWQTVGRLDPNRWIAKMGSRWRQRGGRVLVESPGDGFGGRSLLLRSDEAPKLPFELAVSVKLDDESGAAGLVFHSDGGQKHYGFYPSGGRIRLTSFEGPSVFSWNVLRELSAPGYKQGDWNEIKVRVEKNKIVAFVNNQQLLVIDEVIQPAGKIGLCKFRDTKAQFKNFRFGPHVDSQVTSPERQATLRAEIAKLENREELTDEELPKLDGDLRSRLELLEQQAREFEDQAANLRAVATDLHIATVCAKLQSLTDLTNDSEIDLLTSALWIAKLDNAELEVSVYIDLVNRMASQIKAMFSDDANEQTRLEILNDFLFRKSGFHGSRWEFYDTANSHLDRVIDDREGLPITLSVLYMSLAKRTGLHVVGVGLPGHFVVRHQPKSGEPQLIDVFAGGQKLSRNQANVMVFRMSGRQPTERDFADAKHIDILRRMLNNLNAIARSKEDVGAMLRYVEAMVAVSPKEASLRGMRGVLRHQQGRKAAAIADLDWVIEQAPTNLSPTELGEIRAIRDRLRE